MVDNRSLDEFLGAQGSREPEPSDPEPAVEAESAGPGETAVDEAADPVHDGEEGAHEVEPMAVTFAWSPSGGRCERCGEAVDERWRDGDALVCGDCKAW